MATPLPPAAVDWTSVLDQTLLLLAPDGAIVDRRGPPSAGETELAASLAALAAASGLECGGVAEHEIERGGARLAIRLSRSPAGILAAVRDVTGQRRTEAVLSGRAAALVRANAELERFAATAAHDLQAPARRVAAFCALLQRREPLAGDHRAQALLESAAAAARRMEILVTDLLRLVRTRGGSEPLRPVALGPLLARVRDDLAEEILAAGAVVEIGELPEIPGDAGQLALLFGNLLRNALTYRSSEPPRITVTARERDDVWQITVADNGVGIAPEDQTRIFAMFERAQGEGAGPGSGIGLALCRLVAERHGGAIELDSRPGEGSRFTLVLPRAGTTGGEDEGLL
jgi:signal transduction histidine kinase